LSFLEKRVEWRTSALARLWKNYRKKMAAESQAEEELRESESSLRELSLALLRAQDEECHHLGQELHDGLGAMPGRVAAESALFGGDSTPRY
jgi:signal transduction histidine kinase